MRTELLSADQYYQGVLEGNPVVLARAITLIESQLPTDNLAASSLIESLLHQTGRSFRIGISGVPGVGKSTFIEALGKRLTSRHKKVAVLTVDPSSIKTRGSILGDKTRMDELSKDPLAFVRPTPAGGHHGGVAGKTREAILLCEAAGYEIIIVETVGVGQSEIAVHGMVDFFLLLMLAGAGDELQGIKKGIIEMADGIAITKADGDNLQKVKTAQADLEHALHFFAPSESGWKTPVTNCSAFTTEGIDKVWEMIDSFREFHSAGVWIEESRKRQNQLWMEEALNEIMEDARRTSNSFQHLSQELKKKVADGSMYPPEAARLLSEALLRNHK